MELTVKKSDLQRELQLTQGVVERKTTIPILSNLLLEAKGDALRLCATDLELGIKTACAAKVKKDGAGTVPARRLLEIIRTLPEADVKLKALENHRVELRCERSNFKLVGLSRENFPALPEFPHTLVKIPAGLFATLIAKTQFAISPEETRYTLNGALLLLKPESITMVATDGHRLAHVESETKFEGLKGEVRVLVPKKAMAEVARLLAEAEEKAEVEFARDDAHLFFKLGERLLIARLLTGQFPNYEAVLPRENTRIVVLDRDAAANAVRRADIVADQRSRAISLALTSEKVEITAQSAESGEAQEELVPGKPYAGEPLKIGFNASYLLDFFGAAAAGPISFEFKDDQSAGQLRPLAEEDLKYRYVVMPMRL
jgi:DNA polymerase-3 subunit beta